MRSVLSSLMAYVAALTLAFPTILSADDSFKNLISGDVDKLEQRFSSLQSAFRQEKITEYELLDAYKVFYITVDLYLAQFDAWIKKYPKSPSAQVAMGVYYRKLGESRRGGDYIQQVPLDAREYLSMMCAKAKPHLTEALRLEPHSYIAGLHLLNIEQFEGDDAAARQYLDRANSILPKNFLARARYMVHLAPKWGGSFEAMEGFLGECSSSNGSGSRRVASLHWRVDAETRSEAGVHFIIGADASALRTQVRLNGALGLGRSPQMQRTWLRF